MGSQFACQVESCRLKLSKIEKSSILVESNSIQFIAIADGTYCYIEKSFNNYMKRMVIYLSMLYLSFRLKVYKIIFNISVGVFKSLDH